MASYKEGTLCISILFEYLQWEFITAWLIFCQKNKIIKKLSIFYAGSFGSATYQVWNLEQVIKHMNVSIASSVKIGIVTSTLLTLQVGIKVSLDPFFHCPYPFFLQSGSSDYEYLSFHTTISVSNSCCQPPGDLLYQNATKCSFPFWTPSTIPHYLLN